MVSVVDVFLLAGIAAGGVLCWFGYRVSRLSARLGRRSFVVFAVTLGVGCIFAGVAGFVTSVSLPGSQSSWDQLPVLFWLLSTGPWFVFSLQYTGTRTRVSPRAVGLIALPYLFIILPIGLAEFSIDNFALNVLGGAAFIYIVSLVVGGSYLLLRTTRSYGHVSFGQGISLVTVAVGTLAVWNAIGMATTETIKAGAYAAGAGIGVLGLGTALFRYGLFESMPSVGTLGEQALTRETDDLMFVVDDDDQLIEINETATEAVGVARSNSLGRPLDDLTGHDAEALQRAETVSLQTGAGTRQYDPQVSAVNDPYGNDIGAMVSLRDVTDRELREQRLAVLNRVLRHNLRNEADVVKSHAEALEGESSAHVTAIDEAADTIAALGRQANRIDQYVSDPADVESVDLSRMVRSVLDALGPAEAELSVAVDAPDSASVVANRRAIESALRSVLDNALSYADSTVTVSVEAVQTGYSVTVADDGPGIPDWELDSLDTGTESPLEHSTGLGLWQLKWAVMTLNGELSFDTDDGTTVEFVVPDRGTTDAPV